jgi:hypothetical protein
MAAEGNGMAAEGNGMAAEGNGMAAEGNGMAAEGNGMAAEGNAMTPEASAMTLAANAMPPETNAMTSEANAMILEANEMAPEANEIPSRRNSGQPRGDVIAAPIVVTRKGDRRHRTTFLAQLARLCCGARALGRGSYRRRRRRVHGWPQARDPRSRAVVVCPPVRHPRAPIGPVHGVRRSVLPKPGSGSRRRRLQTRILLHPSRLGLRQERGMATPHGALRIDQADPSRTIRPQHVLPKARSLSMAHNAAPELSHFSKPNDP